MINEQLYNKTVNTLVKAYFDDALEHNICSKCAIGNLVLANGGVEYHNYDTGVPLDSNIVWKFFFITRKGDQEYASFHDLVPSIMTSDQYFIVKRNIEKTGYSIGTLAQIEAAFEKADNGLCKEDYMFNGLMAVIDVLDKVHQNNDESISQSTKRKFKKPTNKKQDVCV